MMNRRIATARRRSLAEASARVASASAEPALPPPPDANAARKMMIVDALFPAARAQVHAIGLADWKKANPAAFAKVKTIAGVRGRLHRTQTAKATARMHGEAR